MTNIIKTSTELLKDIKVVLGITKKEDEVTACAAGVTEVQFVDIKTEEGRLFRADNLETGTVIQEIQADGSLTEIEDGNYIVVDGEMFYILTISEGKIISYVEKPAEVVEEKPAEGEVVVEQAKVDFSNDVKNMFEIVNILKDQIVTLKSENENIKIELEKIKNMDATKKVEVKNDIVVPKQKMSLYQIAKSI